MGGGEVRNAARWALGLSPSPRNAPLGDRVGEGTRDGGAEGTNDTSDLTGKLLSEVAGFW